jgi:hypothetical protein
MWILGRIFPPFKNFITTIRSGIGQATGKTQIIIELQKSYEYTGTKRFWPLDFG